MMSDRRRDRNGDVHRMVMCKGWGKPGGEWTLWGWWNEGRIWF